MKITDDAGKVLVTLTAHELLTIMVDNYVLGGLQAELDDERVFPIPDGGYPEELAKFEKFLRASRRRKTAPVMLLPLSPEEKEQP